jgi:hypothetical protein
VVDYDSHEYPEYIPIRELNHTFIHTYAAARHCQICKLLMVDGSDKVKRWKREQIFQAEGYLDNINNKKTRLGILRVPCGIHYISYNPSDIVCNI